MDNRCPTCGKEVSPDLTFCPRDGTPLGTMIMDPLLGITLSGRYLLRENQGARGRFVMYGGEEEGSGRQVLVTAMHIGEDERQKFFSVFRRRAEQLLSLEHPSCSIIRDFGLSTENVLYLVEGAGSWVSLRQELEQKDRFLPAMALELFSQLLDGLDFLHGHDLAHGNLSTSALRLYYEDDGTPQLKIPLSDIPCQIVDPDGDPAGHEYRVSAVERDPVKADLYAAVLLLAEMLTGVPTTRGRARDELDLSRLDLDEEMRGQLGIILDRGLVREGQQEQPYRSAFEIRRALEAITGHSRFGRYHLLHQIAEGGMGEIYLARAEGIEGIDLDRHCVIKTIRTNLANDQQFVERFLSEARVLASLSHGNIVPVHDVGKVGTTFYIAMEYVAGHDLREILARAKTEGRRLPVPLALFIARELVNGLAYAHRARVQKTRGLVHRDVSPHNTLVSYDGEVRLIDFGLVQGAKGDPIGEEGGVMGKLCYLSPEQALAEPLDRRTDIYSAGLVLFEMLTGEPFFNQETTDQVMAVVARPIREPPSARTPDIPPTVDRICLRAMAADIEQRYDTAAALRDDLSAELARIAPRTNPEEVGAFVRALFPDEQIEKQRVFSDLSRTLPPLPIPDDDLPGAERSEAISLLGVRPTTVHLADTPGAALPASMDSPASDAETELVPAPAAYIPAVSTHEIDMSRRRPVFLIVTAVIILLTASMYLGWWISRRGQSAQEGIRRYAGPEMPAEIKMKKVPLPRRPAAALPPDASVASAPAPAPARRSTRRLQRIVSAPMRAPAPCLITFKLQGGSARYLAGAGVYINSRRAGTLPLSRPLEVPPEVAFKVVVRKKDRKAGVFSQQIQRCAPGERLSFVLRATR